MQGPGREGREICHAHAAQQAMALRQDMERRMVLAEAVAEMRRRGKPECEMADLFTDFKGIQVTLAVVSRALIPGRIDCKTAGRLLVGLQMASKLLWMVHRKGREGRKENAGVAADLRRRAQIEQESEAGIASGTNGANTFCRARYRWRGSTSCVRDQDPNVPGEPARLQGRSMGAGESCMT